MCESLVVGVDRTDCMRPGGLALTRIALSRCCFGPGARVLDVGCGSAATVEFLIDHSFNALGVDPSVMALRRGLKRNTTLPLISAEGEFLPFTDSTWDGVFLECVLSSTRDMGKVLGESRRILKSKGWLVLSDLYVTNPGEANTVRNLPHGCCLASTMTKDELLGKLNANGFQLAFWEDHSLALKTFIARLVFSYVSTEKFWSRIGQDNGDPADIREMNETIARVKPGYFLLIAQKA